MSGLSGQRAETTGFTSTSRLCPCDRSQEDNLPVNLHRLHRILAIGGRAVALLVAALVAIANILQALPTLHSLVMWITSHS